MNEVKIYHTLAKSVIAEKLVNEVRKLYPWGNFIYRAILPSDNFVSCATLFISNFCRTCYGSTYQATNA